MTHYYAIVGLLVIVLLGFRLWGRDRIAQRRQILLETRLIGLGEPDSGVITDELEVPYWQRVVTPKWRAARKSLARRITPGSFRKELQDKLQSAGMSLSAEEFFLYRLGGAIAGIILAALMVWRLLPSHPMDEVLVPVFVGAVIYLLPGVHVITRAQRRLGEIESSLPEVFDLLSVSVEAGLAFDGALRRVVANVRGPAEVEFGRVLTDMQLGVARAAALASLAERTHSPQLRRFAALMAQSDRTGSGIGVALKTQAHDIKDYRSAKAREKAASIPIKIIFPMVIFIFPAIFIVLLGPAVLSIMKVFH